MNKFKYIILAFIAVFCSTLFTSCNTDEDLDEDFIEDILGTWGSVRLNGAVIIERQKFLFTGYFDPINNPEKDVTYNVEYQTEEGGRASQIVSFPCMKFKISENPDGTYTMFTYVYQYGEWKLSQESTSDDGINFNLGDNIKRNITILFKSPTKLIVEYTSTNYIYDYIYVCERMDSQEDGED